MAAPHLFVVSHNNAREGAPRLCAKLALALHQSGRYARVHLCALRPGACPEPDFPVAGRAALAAQAAALLRRGLPVRILLSTVVCTGLAPALRADLAPAGGDLLVAGLVHEVRNETFAWVRPAHLAGLDRLAFVAHHTAASYGPEFAPGTPRAVIHNWLSADERRLADQTPASRHGRVVLAVGVVAPHKGQLHAARAVAALRASGLPDLRLLVAGHVYDPEYAARVRDACPGGVEIAGALPHAEVVRLLRSCLAFVHASPMESCSLSILEAMYCGCPVVAARCGGVPEQIAHGADGLLFPPGDPRACAEHLRSLADDPALRDALGAAAARSARDRFAEPDKIDAYHELLL